MFLIPCSSPRSAQKDSGSVKTSPAADKSAALTASRWTPKPSAAAPSVTPREPAFTPEIPAGRKVLLSSFFSCVSAHTTLQLRTPNNVNAILAALASQPKPKTGPSPAFVSNPKKK
jgi:hypothetical protein